MRQESSTYIISSSEMSQLGRKLDNSGYVPYLQEGSDRGTIFERKESMATVVRLSDGQYEIKLDNFPGSARLDWIMKGILKDFLDNPQSRQT